MSAQGDDNRHLPGSNGGSPTGDADQAESDAAPAPLIINAQYVKDLSFEVPGAPGIFAQMQQRAPDINIKVDVQARNLEANVFEVVLHTTAECRLGDATAFLLELAYGGVFTLNVAADDVRPVLLIECPRLLFPFARQILAATTLNGGFLPLMLGPVDFAALYQRQQQEIASDPAGPQALA